MTLDRDLTHRRFLVQLTLVFMAVCALAAGANYLIDPYGLFGTPRIDGINALKPAAPERVRVSKPYMAKAAAAHTVIGGNSRPELGIDPQSPCWSAEQRPVFNIGIPGASFYMQTQYVKHAVAAGATRRVFMGVDFLDFLIDTNRQQHQRDWTILAQGYAGRLDIAGENVSDSRRLIQRAQDHLNSLLSLEAVSDSIYTLTRQRTHFSSDRRADGFNPAREYQFIIRNEGQHVLFAQKNRELARTLSRPNLGLFNYGTDNSEAFEALKGFLAWTAANDVEVTLFINPYHVHYLSLIELSGNWPLFEQWKRTLVRIAGEHDEVLWDFNTVDAYSTEMPPAAGERHTAMQWYWEPAHYKATLGELMIAQMTGRQCAGIASAPGLGEPMNGTNIDRHLDQLRANLADYWQRHPQEPALLRALFPR